VYRWVQWVGDWVSQCLTNTQLLSVSRLQHYNSISLKHTPLIRSLSLSLSLCLSVCLSVCLCVCQCQWYFRKKSCILQFFQDFCSNSWRQWARHTMAFCERQQKQFAIQKLLFERTFCVPCTSASVERYLTMGDIC